MILADLQKLSDDELRVKVAELLGWVWYRLPRRRGDLRPYRCLFHPLIHESENQSPEWLVRADGTERICGMGFMAVNGQVPDYPGDLNACAEFYKVLSPDQDYEFGEALARIIFQSEIDSNQLFRPNGHGWSAIANATARQRCLAFVATFTK